VSLDQMSDNPTRNLVEAILFLENRPVNLQHLVKITGMSAEETRACIEELRLRYSDTSSSFMITQNDSGDFHLTISDALYKQLSMHYDSRKKMRLSNQALETLAIVAYRQPVTRAEIEKIRGVKVGHVLKLLIDYQLIKFAGKKDTVGKPMMYRTTDYFLRSFGLLSLKDLPPLSEFEKE